MIIYQEYMTLFRILDYCFRKGVYDDLPPLLGEMSVDLFDDSMPADMMVYDDWKEPSRNIKSSSEWRSAIISLLESYEEKYHFCFDDTKEVLSGLTEAELDMFILLNTDSP